MDFSVKQALSKWPNVPAVYGWLSLDERGRWHIHDDGGATNGGVGGRITSPQILAFIARNYGSDEQGQWFFQNGPQRVFVRLDAAPYVLRVSDTGDALVTHTDEPIRHIEKWWLDELGNLYAHTDKGAARVDGRDLESVLNSLHLEPQGTRLLDTIETLLSNESSSDCLVSHPHYPDSVPLHLHANVGNLPNELGFVANPLPMSS
jgi:hypothetical protein